MGETPYRAATAFICSYLISWWPVSWLNYSTYSRDHKSIGFNIQHKDTYGSVAFSCVTAYSIGERRFFSSASSNFLFPLDAMTTELTNRLLPVNCTARLAITRTILYMISLRTKHQTVHKTVFFINKMRVDHKLYVVMVKLIHMWVKAFASLQSGCFESSTNEGQKRTRFFRTSQIQGYVHDLRLFFQ